MVAIPALLSQALLYRFGDVIVRRIESAHNHDFERRSLDQVAINDALDRNSAVGEHREVALLVFEQGDWVSVALAVVSVLLWTAMLLRARALRPISASNLRLSSYGSSILSNFRLEVARLKSQPQRLNVSLRELYVNLMSILARSKRWWRLHRYSGYFGTVIGMVEMFSSLHGASGYRGEITVAGGISKALLTTQLGLIIAAPGLVFSFMLNRQQLRRAREAKEILILAGGVRS